MTTATHVLTNGESNFIFTVNGSEGVLTTINQFGAEIEKEIMTVEELRQWWKAAFKHGCKRGWTNPVRVEPSAFEQIDDNHWEYELALAQG
jgi:hypothetical protein